MSSRAFDSGQPSADSLFAAWLARHEAGEEADFEALCGEHPHAAPKLRDLYGHWAKVEAVRLQHGLGGSLSQKLRTQYGSEVDPQVTLEDEGPSKPDFSTGVLSRLAGRGPASARYRIKGEVAHGGMGVVLRVWDEDLRRHLAMKLMLGQGVAAAQDDAPRSDSRLLARFLEEAQVTGQLDHPGIVPVHELGLDAEGRVYFTMKLVKGQTLKQVFDALSKGEGGWTQTRVLGLLLKVCEAMSYAHAKGVIHRDLKPANVMVGSYGEVFVMDWGLAKVLGREDEKDIRVRPEPELTTSAVRSDRRDRVDETPDSPLSTMDGDVVGTPAYMPPEQARGDLAAMGPHSDVYAVGAMLYHLLAGHMPYVPPGVKANNYAVWQLVQRGPPDPLSKRAPQVPVELVAICERAMRPEPHQRYADMSALASDLSAYVEGRVVRAYETGAWAEARKWVRRNRPLAAAIAVALVLAIGGLGAVGYVQAEGREVEKVQRERADAQAQEARLNAERAEAEKAKVLRLSDVKVLQELDAEADALWPAQSEKIAELKSWLERARALAGNLAAHRATILEMRARAFPWSDEQRVRDRETHPRAGELVQKQAELDGLIAQLERGLEGDARAKAEERVAELEPQVEALAEEVAARRTWRFDSPEDQWQHDVLAELIGNLNKLEAGLLAQDAITEEHGWSVAKRLSFAQQLETGFAPGGEYARAWEQALPSIREGYPGLDLKPQVGLLPISPDPESGLWEFAHLMTGEPAQRDGEGRLVLREETGVVLVLLPGGTFWMGAQSSDPDGRNYDPQAQGDEGPVHEVALSAFFLSKYELTQGQWLRLTGRNPSAYQRNNLAPTLLQPVEQVTWLDCMEWLQRAGLTLPSEAQWEYGARAGTDTPWWTGAERESLREQHAANLADQAAAESGAIWPDIKAWPELDDGYAVHAPAGVFAPNAFGLHEVAGNVLEWCLDGHDRYFYRNSPRMDPVAPWAGAIYRVTRGGSFAAGADSARAAIRGYIIPTDAGDNAGVRPAKDIVR